MESDRTLATYGINAVCTHLGCVVPFNTAENKFICPCHGSQYNNQGRVVRGPAPLVSKSNSIIIVLHYYLSSSRADDVASMYIVLKLVSNSEIKIQSQTNLSGTIFHELQYTLEE